MQPQHRHPQLAPADGPLHGGLALTHVAEPAAQPGGDPHAAARYRRVPCFHIMEWRKPGAVRPPP